MERYTALWTVEEAELEKALHSFTARQCGLPLLSGENLSASKNAVTMVRQTLVSRTTYTRLSLNINGSRQSGKYRREASQSKHLGGAGQRRGML